VRARLYLLKVPNEPLAFHRHNAHEKGANVMKRSIFFLLTTLFLGIIFPKPSLPLDLWDDFSGTSFDKTKWRHTEFVREIREFDGGNRKLLLKQASPNPVLVESYNYSYSHNLNFIDPNSVNSIQADVKILEHTITSNGYTRARLVGRWYNDGAGTRALI